MKTFIVVLAVLSATLAEKKTHPLSEKFIEEINNKQSTWKAGKNFELEDLDRVRGLLGVHKDNSKYTLPCKTNFKVRVVPKEFDARTNWPDCKSIGEIRDQAACGSSWAFGAAEAMTDRICIATEGQTKVSVSAGHLLACCDYCGKGCSGGYISYAWKYWVDNGIVSGGGYGTSNGCYAYQFPECDHQINGTKGRPPCGENKPTPACKNTCDDPSLNFKKEKTFGNSAYSLSGEEEMKADILENGPIEAAFNVFADFLNYKSGVYQHIQGESLGVHAIKILGWGVENGTSYWLIANSWNEDWGEKGFFKMLRGSNECGIETSGYAGVSEL